jgi:hypothetical protein
LLSLLPVHGSAADDCALASAAAAAAQSRSDAPSHAPTDVAASLAEHSAMSPSQLAREQREQAALPSSLQLLQPSYSTYIKFLQQQHQQSVLPPLPRDQPPPPPPPPSPTPQTATPRSPAVNLTLPGTVAQNSTLPPLTPDRQTASTSPSRVMNSILRRAHSKRVSLDVGSAFQAAGETQCADDVDATDSISQVGSDYSLAPVVFSKSRYIATAFNPAEKGDDEVVVRRARVFDAGLKRVWVFDRKAELPVLPAVTVEPTLKKYRVEPHFDAPADTAGSFSDFVDSRQHSGQALTAGVAHAILQAADQVMDLDKVFAEWLRSQGQHATAERLELVFKDQLLPKLTAVEKLADAHLLTCASFAQESLSRRNRRLLPKDMPVHFNQLLQAVPPSNVALFDQEQYADFVTAAGQASSLPTLISKAWTGVGRPKGSQPLSALARAESTRSRSSFGGRSNAPAERTPPRTGRSRSRSRSRSQSRSFRRGPYSRSPSPRTPGGYRRNYNDRNAQTPKNNNYNNKGNKRGGYTPRGGNKRYNNNKKR